MDKYQQLIDEWAQTLELPYWKPLSQLARVSEEVGELARILNHIYGDKPKKVTEATQELGEEIADVMFALICIANAHSIDLDHEVALVIEKAKTRDNLR
ncbi:MAG: nucleotide pyrophosphohydrolase, partial [Candidatus Saccharimonadia bacterium]